MHTNTDITDRNKTEIALLESNKQLQATFDRAGIGLTCMALDGQFLRVNQKFCDIVGYTQDELLQRACQEITYPDDLESDFSCIRRLLTGGASSYTREKRYIRKDGDLVWIEVTFSLVLDEAEEPLWFLSVVHEISDRKRMEEALLASEEKFRTLVTKTEEIVYMIAEDGTFLLSEGKGLAKLGLKPGQVVGKSVFELYKDYPDMLEEMRRAFNGETVTGEVNVNGIYFRSWYTPHKNHAGEIIGLLGLSVNITDQKNAEKSLAQSETLFRMIYENAPVMIDAFDESGRCFMWNRECENVFGWNAEEIFSHENPLDLFYPDPEVQKQVTESIALKPEKIFREWTPLSKDGSERICLWANFKLPDGKVISFGHDITEQRMSEHKIQAYQKRLKSLASELTLTEERERRNIALDLHDHVGQSLAFTRMQLAMAQKESSDSKVTAILDEVSGSLRQAIQDTRNVISDLSSPLINELGLSTALSEWLRDWIGERHGLEIQFIDDGDPKPLSDDTKSILYRSVRELLTNVVRHANASRVSVRLQRRGSTVQIVVEDDGVGLADGRHPEMDTNESGFGLFSIKERMSGLSGSLEIESHPGRGVKAILTALLEPSTPPGNIDD